MKKQIIFQDSSYPLTVACIALYKKLGCDFGFRIDTEDQKTIYHEGIWNGFSLALGILNSRKMNWGYCVAIQHL